MSLPYKPVEVIREKDGTFAVKLTWREPMEYFFEIAVHRARFEYVIDANRLMNRIKHRLDTREDRWQSVANAIDPEQWDYHSSAYDGRYKAAPRPTFRVPQTERAAALATQH